MAKKEFKDLGIDRPSTRAYVQKVVKPEKQGTPHPSPPHLKIADPRAESASDPPVTEGRFVQPTLPKTPYPRKLSYPPNAKAVSFQLLPEIADHLRRYVEHPYTRYTSMSVVVHEALRRFFLEEAETMDRVAQALANDTSSE